MQRYAIQFSTYALIKMLTISKWGNEINEKNIQQINAFYSILNGFAELLNFWVKRGFRFSDD